ncbi:hypothetical protein F5887DRAFT_1078701 [Amanita rubescens]|nr:hypothetical protein F5887DRAFT_1078854 [Amanita rubescens]KAF8336671.1 hypothetical protein F5887DRAFT_1078701 [Amanita rubescens]
MALVNPRGPEDNNVKRLHDYSRAKHIGKPNYTSGAYNGNQWTATVQIDGTDRGKGMGSSKVKAEDAAAAQALQTFEVDWVEPR